MEEHLSHINIWQRRLRRIYNFVELSFLLDTNVVIQFEEVGTDRQIKGPFQQLHNLLIENSLPFNYHPLTESELQNDKDGGRQGEMLSRVKKYPKIDQPPVAEGPELEKLFGAIRNTHDLIDCQLLYAIKRNCATYLISEDARLVKRVAGTDLEDRVLFVADAIHLITRRFKPESVQLPNVNHEYVYNLDISLPFFDSLKADYPKTPDTQGFEAWIQKLSLNKRRCWTIKVAKELTGLIIYKHDEKAEHDGIPMPSVKLCTFKVDEKFDGQKFGELLLKTAHQYAVKNSLKAMWVTTHEKQTKLIYFLKRFGFQVHGDLKNNDMIFYKVMNPPADLPEMDPLQYHILYSPHAYDHPGIKKFIIPIQSAFHDMLFPEVTRQPTLDGLAPKSDIIPGNTIRKVYLSHSKMKGIPPGSLIYFYRSSPEQYIRTRGIVERARRLTDMESLAAAIGKRSVYSREQVGEMIQKEVFVIDFRLIDHCHQTIHLTELTAPGIFNRRPPQSIMELEHSKYLKLKKLWAKKDREWQ